MIKRTAIPAFG